MTSFRAWQEDLLLAAPLVAFVIYLFYTWFAVLNRHLIFLYFHDMGFSFDTTPFGRVTASRYWMSGLVAGGALMVLYAVTNLVLGRLSKRYRAPAWWRLWTVSAIPLLVVVPAIVMTVNDPVLPFSHAVRVMGALLVGVAMALQLGELAARRPLQYILLMIDGVGMAGVLTWLRAAPGYVYWLSRGDTARAYMFLGVLGLGTLLLAVVTAIRARRHRAIVPTATSLLVAGLSVHYLLLPLCHHLFWCKDDGSWRDPDYFGYIPSAENYFSGKAFFELALWAALALVAVGVTRLRRRLPRRRAVVSRGSED
jgi:hypothetical protein